MFSLHEEKDVLGMIRQDVKVYEKIIKEEAISIVIRNISIIWGIVYNKIQKLRIRRSYIRREFYKKHQSHWNIIRE